MSSAINPAFTYWFLTTTLLFLKMLSNSVIQGQVRIKAKSYPLPENARYFAKSSVKDDPEIVVRASNCWRNDLENIPMFLILALAFVIVGGGPTAMLFYGLLFTSTRFLHSYYYLTARQPHRFLCYLTGLILTLTMTFHTWILIFTR